MITTIFILLALICFLMATANYPTAISIGWLGAAFLALDLLVTAAHVT